MFKVISNANNSLVSNAGFRELAHLVGGVFLLFLMTQISIPLKPVPITLQTVGVMLIGLVFERKVAVQAVVSYLLLGMVGVPVFSNFGSGYQHLLGPTGGYLIGFLGAVICMTTYRKYMTKDHWLQNALNCAIGTLVIFACGILWLTHFIGFHKAIQVGLLPFIMPGMVKIIFLILSVRYLKRGAY